MAASSTLELPTGLVGTKSDPLTVEITPRMIMNYAAGIDDPNPWHFADDRPDGIVAPPMMTWALTWRFSVERQRYWGDSGVPLPAAHRGVHFTEDLRWQRALLPGDRLTIQGEIVQLMTHRSGTYMQTRYVGTDSQGETVLTEHVGGMLRDVRCSDASEEYVGRGTPSDLRTAGAARTVIIPIHRLAAHIYDGCADIHNPIHTSKAFAQSVGLPDIILHGTATLAFAVREITNTEADGDPRRVRGIYASFTSMVFLGSEVQLEVLGTVERDDQIDVHFQVVKQDGKKAIRDGCVTVASSA